MCVNHIGYAYESLEDIDPFLENPYEGNSMTLLLARELSQRLDCYVVAGFPERASSHTFQELEPTEKRHDARHIEGTNLESAHLPRISCKAYNAALLTDQKGKLVKVFRKHFLYEADTPWADEGPGFEYVELPSIGRLCVAICMDLNRAYYFYEYRND